MRLSAGFTIVELIVTMIVIGIMAVVVVPRMSLLGGFDARGVSDQAASYLRFAQKSALAQRRHVSISGLLDPNSAPAMTVWNGTACTGTSTTLNYSGRFNRPKSPIDASGTDAFCFDTLGGVTASGDITYSGGGSSHTLRVEAITGYVHAL